MIDVNRFRTFFERIRNFLQRRSVKIIFSVFAILFAVAVLGLLLFRERDALINYAWKFQPWALIASFLVYFIDLLLVVWIWGMIMRSLGSKVGFWQHFRSFSIANIAKRLPGTVWYVVWRGDLYKQDGLSIKATTLASGVEIAVSIFGGVLATIIFAVPILVKYPAGISVLVALVIICLIFLHPRMLGKILKLMGTDIQLFNYRLILGWIGLYFIVWVIGGIILFLISNIVYPIGLEYLGYIIGCWSLVGISSYLLYFMPSNMGFNEIGISLLLSAIMPSSFAVIVAVISRAALLIYEIIMAVGSWLLEYKNKRI